MKSTSSTEEGLTGRLGKALAAVALSAATVLTLASPASAVTGGPTAGSGAQAGGGTEMAPDNTYYGAPTANLERLNQTMRTAAKSISASLTFDKFMATNTANIKIAVAFGTNGARTQSYSNANGTRFSQLFAVGDGKARYETLNITMVERKGGKNYTYNTFRSISIRPLWDVAISPLKFTLLSDCDYVGDSEIELWFSHNAARGTVTFDLDSGESHLVQEYFAKTWTEVGVSNDLRVPLVSFSEDDPTGASISDGDQPLGDERLLPGGTHTLNWVEREALGQCSARIEYTVTITLRAYSL